jgi:hypothetical protein
MTNKRVTVKDLQEQIECLRSDQATGYCQLEQRIECLEGKHSYECRVYSKFRKGIFINRHYVVSFLECKKCGYTTKKIKSRISESKYLEITVGPIRA